MIKTSDERENFDILFNKKDLEELDLAESKRTNIITLMRKKIDAQELMVTLNNNSLKNKTICLPMYHFSLNEAISFMEDYCQQDARKFAIKGRKDTLAALKKLKKIALKKYTEEEGDNALSA